METKTLNILYFRELRTEKAILGVGSSTINNNIKTYIIQFEASGIYSTVLNFVLFRVSQLKLTKGVSMLNILYS